MGESSCHVTQLGGNMLTSWRCKYSRINTWLCWHASRTTLIWKI